MKKYSLFFILCSLCLTACRPTGDDLTSYGQKDFHAFADANVSLAGEFRSFWMAMNENYGIWDYEAENGLDWDEVYATYLPKFEALDSAKSQQKTLVSDAELYDLYCQFLDSLHDGHIAIQIMNLHTGRYFMISPSTSRNMRERPEAYNNEKANVTDLDTYCNLPVTDMHCALEYDATDSRLIVAEVVDSTCARLIRAAEAYVAGVDNAGGPNEFNDSIYAAMKQLISDAAQVQRGAKGPLDSNNAVKAVASAYNSLCSTYSLLAIQLNVPTPNIGSDLAGDGLKFIRYALFNGNIAYLRFGGFYLTSYLSSAAPADTTSLGYAYYQAVNRVWDKWFNAIQTLHAHDNLGGVIIDVRNNGGGMMSDYQYVLGALMPSGGYESHTLRYKDGIGRLDFSPLIPFRFSTYAGEHEVVEDEPIVILVNTHSISMAELTTWGVKSRPNGYVVGTRTWGGLSGLNDNPATYSTSYSGGFGEYNVTPFYGYVPRFVSLFGDDLKILEGVGIEPDLEKQLDVNLWQTQKRDNQLEAAIDYVHSK